MEGYPMLTLTRSVGETIRIGDDIEVHVVEVRGGTVRLGFKAPREVAIHREEVYRQIAEANLLAAQVTADSLGALAAFAPLPAADTASGQRPGEAPAPTAGTTAATLGASPAGGSAEVPSGDSAAPEGTA
jgi:carbon storage regulator